MAEDWKTKVSDLFTCENGPFSVHEIMDRLEISSNAVVNVAVFELVRQGVIVQVSEMPPKWQLGLSVTSELKDLEGKALAICHLINMYG